MAMQNFSPDGADGFKFPNQFNVTVGEGGVMWHTKVAVIVNITTPDTQTTIGTDTPPFKVLYPFENSGEGGGYSQTSTSGSGTVVIVVKPG
jgi:hypothetical protein